jgi:hypothetical protein
MSTNFNMDGFNIAIQSVNSQANHLNGSQEQKSEPSAEQKSSQNSEKIKQQILNAN